MDFVGTVCMVLDIPAPIICFDVSKFDSGTKLAMVDPKTRMLYLRTGEVDINFCFCVSHELRHLWQADTDYDYYFGDYSNDSSDTEAYNSQIAEIDANAFGDMMCVAMYGYEVHFKKLSPELQRKIKQRRAELELIYTDKQ